MKTLSEFSTEIFFKLSNDPEWVKRAIVVIFENQTADEQADSVTRHHNGIGFNGRDAEIMSSFARQILAGRRLSEKQLNVAFRVMPKYHLQLAKVAVQKAEYAQAVAAAE